MPSSVAMRTVCVPIGPLCIICSPDFVVPNVLLSRNQNIFASVLGDIAIKLIGWLDVSDVITVVVFWVGDMIIGALLIC